MRQNMLGHGAQEEASQLWVTTRVDDERSGHCAQSPDCRPWGVEHCLDLDDDRRLGLLGTAESVEDCRLGRFMNEPYGLDKVPCGGCLLVHRQYVEQGVPSGRFP